MEPAPTHRDSGASATSEPVRKQCDRLLRHPLFANSKRYSSLFSYIVDRTLDGRHEYLKERMIGIEVFGRPADYDTSGDSTVRVAMKEVRKRLASYYADPAHKTELRIDLPTGTYVAVFTQPHQAAERPTPIPQGNGLKSPWVFVPLAVVLLLAGFWGATRYLSSPTAIDDFWAPLLSNQGPDLIVLAEPVPPPAARPAASAATGMSLEEYIAKQANFPMAELNSANSINAFLQRNGRQSATHLASSVTLSDLKKAPVVLLGSYPNEWAMRFGSAMHFTFQADHSLRQHYIQDISDPNNRKWSIIADTPLDKVKNEYAIITRAIDPTTGQWWIGIGGTTVLGTLGAQQMVLDPKAMSTLSAQLPAGWQRENMQVVIEFEMVNGSLGASKVVGKYLW